MHSQPSKASEITMVVTLVRTVFMVTISSGSCCLKKARHLCSTHCLRACATGHSDYGFGKLLRSCSRPAPHPAARRVKHCPRHFHIRPAKRDYYEEQHRNAPTLVARPSRFFSTAKEDMRDKLTSIIYYVRLVMDDVPKLLEEIHCRETSEAVQ
jgi:hypothetical protein